MHIVAICGAVGGFMVARISNNQIRNASWINTQRRYCAGPRLDRTRDASLEHQQGHGAAQNTTGRDEVVVGDSKHKGIARKQDIREDHRKVKKTQPSRPFLAILSVLITLSYTVVAAKNFFCWKFWVVARRKRSSYANDMASQSLLSKTA